MKTCCVCKRSKSKNKFYRRSKVKDTLESRCKVCTDEITVRRYYEKHPERPKFLTLEQKREHNKNTKLKYRYGITQKEYNKLFEKQKGCCAICGEHQTEFSRRLAVDHNHSTKEVRGLLCTLCNQGIGMLNADEDTLLLHKAIDYLESSIDNERQG